MLINDPVPRSLSDVVYRVNLPVTMLGVRVFTLRLRLPDLLASMCVPMLIWLVLHTARMDREPLPLFGFPYDPWGWMGLALVLTVGFSVSHWLRPEGDVWNMIEGAGVWVRNRNRWGAQLDREDALWSASRLRRGSQK